MLRTSITAIFVSIAMSEAQLYAQPYEESPIRYSRRRASGEIAQWEYRIQQGQDVVTAKSSVEMRDAVLEELEVPAESQILVFSHTSFQNSQISGDTPRAIYFNENHYVGWVQNGDVELATADPKLGMAFYQIEAPKPQAGYLSHPKFIRNPDCLFCHAGTDTTVYPGLVAHSVFATRTGAQILRDKSFNVDHRTPVENRWGGWLVTGQVGGPRHRGNVFYSTTEFESASLTDKDTDLGIGIEDLSSIIDMSPYPVATSDIAALLVFEHQIIAHNAIVETFSESRRALWNDSKYMVGKPSQPETISKIDASVDKLLKAMLYIDEASLSEFEIIPNSAFVAAFHKNRKADSENRSLKDFNLTDRIFKHRLSYMIYSDSFAWLPETAQERFFIKLKDILQEKSEVHTYAYINPEEKAAIYSIVKDTLPESGF